MPITPYADIDALLDFLLSSLQIILGEKLAGLYLFGSLVTGDFDYGSSDIDLVAAICSDLTAREFEQLDKMHGDVTSKFEQWDDRIEIGYLSLENLKRPVLHCPIALISPGEPFHIKKADHDWIINRYVLREKGLALYGPAPKACILRIPKAVLENTLQELMEEWREWIKSAEIMRPRKYQAYAILTMCRALYLFRTGDFASKRQSALWAVQELPSWSALVHDALLWRECWRDEHVDHDATLPETLPFINFVIDQIQN